MRRPMTAQGGASSGQLTPTHRSSPSGSTRGRLRCPQEQRTLGSGPRVTIPIGLDALKQSALSWIAALLLPAPWRGAKEPGALRKPAPPPVLLASNLSTGEICPAGRVGARQGGGAAASVVQFASHTPARHLPPCGERWGGGWPPRSYRPICEGTSEAPHPPRNRSIRNGLISMAVSSPVIVCASNSPVAGPSVKP